jgi:cytoskeletal protein RodZ
MNDQSNAQSLMPSGSIGAFLRSEREKQGLDLNDIFQTTKIRPNILEYIEKEQFDKISTTSDIFLISFLKSYAQALDLDPDPIITKYHDSMSQKEETSTKSGMANLGITPQMLLTSIIIIVFIGIVVLIVPHIKTMFSQKKQIQTSQKDLFVGELDNNVDFSFQNKPVTFTEHNAQATESLPPKKEELTPTNQNDTDQVETNEEKESENQAEKYSLRLKALEKTWLKITVDDQSPNEFMLKPGDTLSKEANKEFQILLGNATGVEIFLNDKPVAINGRSGQVMTLILPR